MMSSHLNDSSGGSTGTRTSGSLDEQGVKRNEEHPLFASGEKEPGAWTFPGSGKKKSIWHGIFHADPLPGEPSTAGPIAAGEQSATNRLTLNQDDVKRIYAEAGTQILALQKELGWRAAHNKKRWDKLVGSRSDQDEMKGFIEYVVNHPASVVTTDSVDPRYQQYSTTINDRALCLTAGVDADGNGHVFTVQNALAKSPSLKIAFDALRNKGWTIQYGAQTSFDAKARAVTIDPRSPPGIIKSLSRSLSTSLHPDLRHTAPNVAERAHQYLLMKESGKAYAVHYTSVMKQYDEGDGFYNAVSRMLDARIDGEFDEAAMPGLSRHDAVTIMLYWHTCTALSELLRSVAGSANYSQENISPFTDLINNTLNKFEIHDGLVCKTTDRFRGDVPGSQIEKYVVGQIVSEPHFLTCTKDQGLLRSIGSNVRYFINSRTGKDLSALSLHQEVMIGNGACFKVLDVQYKNGSTPVDPFPEVDIFLDELAMPGGEAL